MSTITWRPERAMPSPQAPRWRHALVALDGTSESLAALIWLMEHGHLQHGELRLVTVDAGGTGAKQAIVAAPELSRRHRIWLDEATWYEVPAASRRDRVADAIADLAGPDDIIVVGGKPTSSAPGPQASSLALSLATRSPVPVVAVPEERSPAAAETVHLLVDDYDAADGLDEPAEPLRYAAAEALRRGVPLHLLHGSQLAGTPGREMGTRNTAANVRSRMAHAAVDSAQRQAETAYPTVRVWCQVVEGPVPDVLLPHLTRAGLAVVGRSGSTGTAQAGRGAVAFDLIAALPCPVAVVPINRRRPEH